MNNVAPFPATMTVEEFQHWRPPADLRDCRWQLFDGEPRCIAPASEDHGAIRREAAFLLNRTLSASHASWRVVTAPSVIPHVRADFNERVPDLGVTCAPAVREKVISDPALLIEILSPSSQHDTWGNVFAYATIPSVQEILVLDGTAVAAELVTRGSDGYWPRNPLLLGRDDQVWLSGLGFEVPLRAFYKGTSLC